MNQLENQPEKRFLTTVATVPWVVVTERDSSCVFKSAGAMVMETPLATYGSIEGAIKMIRKSKGRFGRSWVSPLTCVAQAEQADSFYHSHAEIPTKSELIHWFMETENGMQSLVDAYVLNKMGAEPILSVK